MDFKLKLKNGTTKKSRNVSWPVSFYEGATFGITKINSKAMIQQQVKGKDKFEPIYLGENNELLAVT